MIKNQLIQKQTKIIIYILFSYTLRYYLMLSESFPVNLSHSIELQNSWT